MFSMVHRKPHKERRRILSGAYSKTTLFASPEIRKISQVLLLERLLPIIQLVAEQQSPLNALEYSLAFSIDFVTAYLFGLCNGTNFMRDVETRKRWLDAHDRTKVHQFWALEFPGLTSLMAKLGTNLLPPEIVLLTKEVQDLCLQMMDKVESSLLSSPNQAMDESTNWTKPVVYDQLLRQLGPSSDNKFPASLPDRPAELRLTIASELMDHIMAGTETSGWTLTYTLYELSLQPELQSALRSELHSFPWSLENTETSFSCLTSLESADLPSPRDLDSLLLLDAIILETLRRHPAVPGAQPRTSRALTSLGHFADIPPGIRVGAQAYSLHRNENVFPHPEQWTPMRWLTCDTEGRENMMRWFWPFGSGGRMCIGNHFAMLGELGILNIPTMQHLPVSHCSMQCLLADGFVSARDTNLCMQY
jgi:hypothetical protein